MNNLLDDLESYLVAQSLISECYKDFIPSDKLDETIVALMEYAGAPTFTGADCSQRYVQVRVRSSSYEDAREKAWLIHKALDKPEDRIIQLTPDRWTIIQALQTPFKLTIDSSTKVTFAFNITIITYRD